MTTDCSATQFEFEGFAGRQVVGAFDGGEVTSNGGAPLLREADRAIGLTAKVARCFRDNRNPVFVEHRLETLIGGASLGHEDLNCASIIRFGPGARHLALDSPSWRGRKSTLNRLGTANGASRYCKISVDDLAMQVFLLRRRPCRAAQARHAGPGCDDPLHA